MPFLDGYEASARIRQYLIYKDIDQPIISAITGHTEQIYVKKAIDYGINQVISKPIDFSILHALFIKCGF